VKKVANKYGTTTVKHGDRFLWNTHKWYVVEFLDDGFIVVRLEGTADVATLPELLVSELVDEYNYSSYYWR
jgi:hypothetical protein